MKKKVEPKTTGGSRKKATAKRSKPAPEAHARPEAAEAKGAETEESPEALGPEATADQEIAKGGSDRVETFIQEYLISFNGAAAARKAGYSERSARTIAARLLAKDNIRARIKELVSARHERLEITGQRIMEEIARIAFANMNDYVTWSDGSWRLKDSIGVSDEAAAAINEISHTHNQWGGNSKFKLHDKLKALELLGRHKDLVLWKDSLEVDPGKNTSEKFNEVLSEVKFLMTAVRGERKSS